MNKADRDKVISALESDAPLHSEVQEAITIMRGLAEDAEPVAWMRPSTEGYDSAFRDASVVAMSKKTGATHWDADGWIPLYTSPQAAQTEAPVAWLAPNPSAGEQGEQNFLITADDTHDSLKELLKAFPVYKSPKAQTEAQDKGMHGMYPAGTHESMFAAQTNEREAFEAWAAPMRFDLTLRPIGMRSKLVYYENLHTDYLWLGWRERAGRKG